MDLFLTNTRLLASPDINWWTGVDYFDGTHSLQSIHCWETLMQCYISPNLMKKQTHPNLGWHILIFGYLLIYQGNRLYSPAYSSVLYKGLVRKVVKTYITKQSFCILVAIKSFNNFQNIYTEVLVLNTCKVYFASFSMESIICDVL